MADLMAVNLADVKDGKMVALKAVIGVDEKVD